MKETMLPPDYKILLNSVYQYHQSQPQGIDHTYIEAIINKAKDYSVVSFDIFDTLLTRLFECPIDLFAYVENQLIQQNIGIPDFAKHRLQAEAEIRNIVYQQEKREEISLDEIYEYCAKILNLDIAVLNQAKDLELQAELDSNITIRDNQELIIALKNEGKKIIFVSDIYLSNDFIINLLENKNLKLYDELYVSSALSATKHSGNIWNHVLKNNKYSSIIHIGDNQHADIERPKNYNIDTYHYSRFLSERRLGAQLSPNIVPFSLIKKTSNMKKGIYSLIPLNEDNFWTVQGETFGAMVLYAFVQWLKEHVQRNQIDHIYFCARDSQIMFKVWHLLELDQECNTSSSYLYLSRKSIHFPAYYIELIKNGWLSDTSLNLIVNKSLVAHDTYKTYFQRIGITEEDLLKTNFSQNFGSINAKFDFSRINDIKIFIQEELKSKLLTLFKLEYENTINYFDQEGLYDPDKKIAIIDLGWNGSIQFALTEFREHKGVKNKLYGFYYGLFREHAAGRLYKNGFMKTAFFNIFSGYEEKKLLQNCVNILENLHSADHETTIGFERHCENNKYFPVLKESKDSKYIEQYSEKISLFQQGALKSIEKWKKDQVLYGIHKCWINEESAKAAILQTCITPIKHEQNYFGNIQHSTLFDHEIFVPLISHTLPSTHEEVSYLLSVGGWECGVIQYWKQRRNEIKPEYYQFALRYFNDFPIVIKNFIEN